MAFLHLAPHARLIRSGERFRPVQSCSFTGRRGVAAAAASTVLPRRALRRLSPSTTRDAHVRLRMVGEPSSATPDDVSHMFAEQEEGADTAFEDDDDDGDVSELSRPDWAPQWLPMRLIRLSPLAQFAVLIPLYLVHLLYFSKKGWELPFKFLAKDKGAGGSGLGNNLETLTLDSVVGFVVIVATLVWRKAMKLKPTLPMLVEGKDVPWEAPRGVKAKLPTTVAFLVIAYLASGYGALFCEQILCVLSVYGVPLTIPTMRAWKVLLGHLMWVYMGVRILGHQLQPFFPPRGKWIRWKPRANWLWWAIGGYYVSSLLFNAADVVNQLILPQSLFNEETVVSKLVNPENNDMVAMAIGSLGPCVSAPVFEEVLYRGFLLPALACYLPMPLAIPVSSVLFAAHHLNICGVLPLTVLGFAWAIFYVKSHNLLVTILIHAMWNSRVFLGSLLGL